MKKLILITLTALAMTGCVTQPRTEFNKAGATQESFKADLNVCEYEAMKHAYVPGSKNPFQNPFAISTGLYEDLDSAMKTGERKHQLILACMAVKGYTVTK